METTWFIRDRAITPLMFLAYAPNITPIVITIHSQHLKGYYVAFFSEEGTRAANSDDIVWR